MNERDTLRALLTPTRLDCQECGGEQDLHIEADPTGCTTCSGTGFVMETSGGGTKPRRSWEPPVYGCRIERVQCRECRYVVFECQGSCKRKIKQRLG